MRLFLWVSSFTILFCSLQNDTKNLYAVQNYGTEISICKIVIDKALIIHKDNLFLRVKLENLKKEKRHSILGLNITELKNPDLEPLSFHLYLELPNETIDLNSFSLYPGNLAGNFNFRVSQYWHKISKAKYVNLIIKLELIEKQKLSDKVFVEFERPLLR